MQPVTWKNVGIGSSDPLNDVNIHEAVSILNQGGIIAYPTEAVWGLGCDPNNDHAIEKLLHIKHRDWQKGLILVASSFSQLQDFAAPLTSEQMTRILSSPKKPTTWLVPKKAAISKLISGKHHTVAIRISNHPVVKKLCSQYHKALVSTSANPEGRTPATTREALQDYFPGKLDIIVDGDLGSARNPSEIRDLISNQIIRQG